MKKTPTMATFEELRAVIKNYVRGDDLRKLLLFVDKCEGTQKRASGLEHMLRQMSENWAQFNHAKARMESELAKLNGFYRATT